MLLPIVTEFDEESNTLYAETDRLGTYCVLDMEVLMQKLGIAPDGTSVENVARQMYSVAPTAAKDNIDPEKYCVTFIFDIRKSIVSSEQLEAYKEYVGSFATEVFAENRDITIRLMTQDVTDFFDDSYKVVGECSNIDDFNKTIGRIKISDEEGFFGNYCTVTDALAYVLDHSDSGVKNYVFDVYAQEDAIFDTDAAAELLKKSENLVNISMISDFPKTITGFQREIVLDTSGININSTKDFGERIYSHVFNDFIPEIMSAILISGYEYVELKGRLNKYNNIDTDYEECTEGEDDLHKNDHLTDWEEVGVDHWVKEGLMSYDDDGNAVLPTIMDCLEFTELAYVEEGLKRFEQELGANFGVAICGKRVLPILSDPTIADSDGDGIVDKYDPNPLIGGDLDTPCLYNSSIMGVENHHFATDCIFKIDGVGETYMCLNCQTEPLLSPESEDALVLDSDNYVLVKMLLAVFKYFQNNGADASAEAVYATIDKIRTIYGRGKYSYSYADGSYASPFEYIHLTEENDYSIICNFSDASETNRKLELYGEISWSILKPAIDIAFLYEPAGKVGMILITAGAFIWSAVSEGISSVSEDRLYDIFSVLTSCALTVADLFLDRGNILSAMNITLSYANKYGVYQYVNNSQNAYLTDRDYHFDITIKSSKGEQCFYTKTEDAFIHSGFEFHVCDKNHKNSNAENYCQSSDNFDHLNGLISFIQTEYATPKKQMYKNMVMIPNFSLPLSLIGEYHYELDTSKNDFVWKKVWR